MMPNYGGARPIGPQTFWFYYPPSTIVDMGDIVETSIRTFGAPALQPLATIKFPMAP